jgi:hypothetical protein
MRSIIELEKQNWCFALKAGTGAQYGAIEASREDFGACLANNVLLSFYFFITFKKSQIKNIFFFIFNITLIIFYYYVNKKNYYKTIFIYFYIK